MAQGTSPHGEGLSQPRADVEPRDWGWIAGWPRWLWQPLPLPSLALGAGAGLAAGLALAVVWHAVTDIGGQGAILLEAGAALAIAAALAAFGLAARAAWCATGPCLRGHDEPAPKEAPSRLLAQMQHELRTPLNAVIGFSEAMQAELHGPLGSTRYQEYAAHISASGGRLLKASEDALAVAATMSALLTDRRGLTRDHLPVAGLLEEAWTAVLRGAHATTRLDKRRCAAAEVACDWRTTSQALQLLLGEAIAQLASGGTVTATSRREGGAHLIELAAVPAEPAPASAQSASFAGEGGPGLRLLLARSLLDVQGATLAVCSDPRCAGWNACIAFPAAANPRAFLHGTSRQAAGSRTPKAVMSVASRVPRMLQAWC